MEISDRHLVRTCKIDLAHDLLQRSSRRELAESSLVSLLPKTTLNEHYAFTTRVALVLLVCSHWWFWVLSTFPFRILTTHCLGSFAGIFYWSNQFFKATCYFNICKKKHPFPRPPNHQPKPPHKLTLMLCCVVCCVLCVMLCYAVLCCVMLCYVVLCYVVLCYVMSCMHVCAYVHVYVYAYVFCVCKCICICICLWICVWVWMCICIFIFTSICICICKFMRVGVGIGVGIFRNLSPFSTFPLTTDSATARASSQLQHMYMHLFRPRRWYEPRST